ncbi:MAG TPA: nucleotidyltransferase domain-containing protein [Nitrososphaera sp.]|jgi:predicted nucleotidyltransferase|nr:nucleotidyltransferase domain-containing protein [Nitrososphaera sp.]
MSDTTDMLLQNYLEDLLNSKVALRLGRALNRYPGRIFTVRKLAEAAGVSVSEAAVVVQELEKYGIVTIQPVGRSYLVELNERSYFVNRILRPIVKAEEQTVAELVSILRKYLTHESIISAILFGSVPRGEARDDSDIDLLVISDDLDVASTPISKAREEVTRVFNGRLSPLIMTRSEIRARARSMLLASILESYIHVAGKDLKEIVERK